MKIPFSWLREFVEIDLGPHEVGEILTMGGVEVEGVEEVGAQFKGVVVGRVLKVWPHPRAERLFLCEVELPQRVVKVVCGAPNVKEGLKVPMALPGTELPGGTVQRREIRGEPSEGMICSEQELGLAPESAGIMVLEPDAPLGMDLEEYLQMKDHLLDLSPTPNRGDCLSVLGVAREVAALTGVPLRLPQTELKEEETPVEDLISVEIHDPDLCSRYTARYLWDIKVGPSPLWMCLRLERSGVRAINNVVDITNYVMLELGQPLHAFDYDRLRGGRIVVRRAQEGERFVTLDGKERFLDAETLLICDAEGPVAIGGVMGGLDSEIEEDTRRVLLESAFFSPSSIRRTSRALRLQTESAYRFERGVDPELAPYASARAAHLMARYAGGKVARGLVDVYPRPLRPPEVEMRLQWVNAFLGLELSEEEVEEYLRRLGMQGRRKGKGRWVVVPPSYRFDIKEEVDLAEELGRLKGYQAVPEEPPRLLPLPREEGRRWALKALKDLMVGYGFYEVITYAFISPRSLEALGISSEALCLLNPLSEEQSVMRTTLLPGLLETARWNLHHGNRDLRIFELRKVYLPREGDLPQEREVLAALAMGDFYPPWWREKGRPADFFLMKGCIEGLMARLHLPKADFVPTEGVPYLHPGQGAVVRLEGEEVGVVGRLHPEVAASFELAEVFLFELQLEPLLERAKPYGRFSPLPKHPALYRDIALLVDEEVPAAEVYGLVARCGLPYIERVEIFDCYTGPPIPKGKKNLALRLFLRAPERTLTDEEADEVQRELINRLQEAGMTLR